MDAERHASRSSDAGQEPIVISGGGARLPDGPDALCDRNEEEQRALPAIASIAGKHLWAASQSNLPGAG